MPSLDLSTPASPALDEDTVDDILYSARAGDLQGLKTDLAAAADANSVSALSILLAAVGETTGNSYILQYLTTLTAPPSLLLTKQNLAGNTCLHYAALNGHVSVVKFIIDCTPPEAKADLISCKNIAGHDAAFEAEGNGKDDVVNFLLGALDGADVKERDGDTENKDEEEEIDAEILHDSGGAQTISSKQAVEETEDKLRQMGMQEDAND